MKNAFGVLKVPGKNVGIVFCNGALIMVLELIGARIITPYVGSSSFVWTAIIGVMMAALAGGYAWGGKLADTNKTKHVLAWVLVVAALLVLITCSVYASVLTVFSEATSDVRIVSVLGALVLFAPAAFLMGSVSPYIAKRHVAAHKNTGQSIGSMYAWGTAGSIVGTFLCGFWLTSYFSNKTILLGIAAALLGLSVYEAGARIHTTKSILLIAGLSITAAVSSQAVFVQAIYETTTAYGTYAVYDTKLQGQPARVLATDKFAWQTGVLLQNPTQAAFPYMQQFVSISNAKKAELKNVLLLGGGAFSYPTLVASELGNVQIDVVEIDPKLEEIAAQYFSFTKGPNVTVIAEDARTYVKNNTKKYDLILLDVFSSIRPPFHLTTQEFVAELAQDLTESGIVVANVIGATTGERADFTTSQVATYNTQFTHVYTYPANTATASSERQNIMLVAAQNEQEELLQELNVAQVTAEGSQRPLRDNFAPVDKLIGF